MTENGIPVLELHEVNALLIRYGAAELSAADAATALATTMAAATADRNALRATQTGRARMRGTPWLMPAGG